MKLDEVKAIASAVLYEGYNLFPYPKSSTQNQPHGAFGGLFPQAFGGGDASSMKIEILIEGEASAAVDVHVRFLQLMNREIGKLSAPTDTEPMAPALEMISVDRLEVDGRDFIAREEAVEREIISRELRLPELAATPFRRAFHFDGARIFEWIKMADGRFVGAEIRKAFELQGVMVIHSEKLDDRLSVLTIRIENISPLSSEDRRRGDRAQSRAFASIHAIVAARVGDFVSLLDPPEPFRDAATRCDNKGAWPVLIGAEDEKNMMLASPILLRDYPKMAPERTGESFDSAEIDEILTLRILAMTDAEKREMVSVGARACDLLERAQALSPGNLSCLCGVDEPEKPPHRASQERQVGVGALVRLRPRPDGDILDFVLRDELAIVEKIERDFEDRIHVAVTLVDDPGRDFSAGGFSGRHFYFSMDEIEPVAEGM